VAWYDLRVDCDYLSFMLENPFEEPLTRDWHVTLDGEEIVSGFDILAPGEIVEYTYTWEERGVHLGAAVYTVQLHVDGELILETQVGPCEWPYCFDKHINGQDADRLEEAVEASEGDPLTFTYVVTNTGSVPITWIGLTDDVFGDLTDECGEFPRTIPEDESDFCAITRAAGQAPDGQRNIGTAYIEYLDDQADPAWYITPELAYSFEKYINGQEADRLEEAVGASAGDILTFTYVVTNTDSVPITWIGLTDDVFDDLTDECGGFPRTIPVDESDFCEITRPAGQAPDGHQNIGMASVEGLDDQDDPAWYITPEQPAYSFEKYINGQDADTLEEAVVVNPDQLLTFRYVVTNTGNVSITWTGLEDDGLEDTVFDLTEDCGGFPRTILEGESDFCEITRAAVYAPGGHLNTGMASVEGLDDQTDPAWYITLELAYSFEKYINGDEADSASDAVRVHPGETLTFTYVVTNISNVSITWTRLTDDVIGDLTSACHLPVGIDVGLSYSCDITGTAETDYSILKGNIGTADVQGWLPQQDEAWYETRGGEAPPPEAPVVSQLYLPLMLRREG